MEDNIDSTDIAKTKNATCSTSALRTNTPSIATNTKHDIEAKNTSRVQTSGSIDKNARRRRPPTDRQTGRHDSLFMNFHNLLVS